jgi:hypothetical protein
MQDAKQILREFLLWTQRLIIHDNEFALVLHTKVFDEWKPKTGETILMGKHQGPNVTSNDAVDQREKLFSLEVQTTADFFDPHVDRKPASYAELLKVLPLIDQIGLLCWTGNTTIDNTPFLCCRLVQSEYKSHIFICVVTLIRHRAMRLESAFAIPTLQGLGDNSDYLCKLTYRVHVRSITHIHTQFQLPSANSFLGCVPSIFMKICSIPQRVAVIDPIPLHQRDHHPEINAYILGDRGGSDAHSRQYRLEVAQMPIQP